MKANSPTYPAALDSRPAAGKTFWLISISQASAAVATEAAGFTAAAMAVGATARVFDGKGSPDLWNQGMESAIAQRAAGIVLLGIDPLLVKAAVAKAGQSNIPVIDAVNGNPNAPLIPGLVGHVTHDASQAGKLQAAYVALKTGCKLDTAIFYTQASPLTTLTAKGAQAELESLCPDTCSAKMENVNAATFATTLMPLAQNVLQRSPDIHYLISTTDSFNALLGAGIKALARDVSIIGASGDTLGSAMKGNGQVADVIYAPLPMVGWAMLDGLLRATSGPKGSVTYGVRLVDKSNWGSDASDATQYPSFTDYQARFKALWGLS